MLKYSFNILIFILITFKIGTAFGQKAIKSRVYGIVYQNSFTDIKSDNSVASVSLDSALQVELGYRVFSIFSFLLDMQQSYERDHKGQGLGARIDLPGFFLIGANKKDLSAESKRYPVNTSIYAKLLSNVRYGQNGATDISSVGTMAGFTMDVFLFNPYSYISAHASVFSLQGNTFSAVGAGLGFQF